MWNGLMALISQTLFCLHPIFSSVNPERAMKESPPSSRAEVFRSPSSQLTFLSVADLKWPQSFWHFLRGDGGYVPLPWIWTASETPSTSRILWIWLSPVSKLKRLKYLFLEPWELSCKKRWPLLERCHGKTKRGRRAGWAQPSGSPC